MSDTLDQTLPADATPSVDRIGTTATESLTSACGTATLGLPTIIETSGSVSFMPRGSKMRFVTNCSQGMPDTRSMMTPLRAYSTLWYCHSERNDAVGWM